MDPELLPQSPREKASFPAKIFFWWILELFKRGWKRDLDFQDLYQVPKTDRSEALGDKLGQAWEHELTKTASKPSLLKAILRVFGWEFGQLGIFALVEECCLKMIQPICLGLLIRFFGGHDQVALNGNMGFVYAGGLVMCSVIYALIHHPFYFEIQHVGMRIRVACCSIVYRKALKLSQSAFGNTTIGQIVNLLSNDVNRFDIGMSNLHYLWVGPIQLLIVVYILWGYFGWLCLIGVAFLILFVPFQSQMGRLFGKLRSQTAVRTDRRMRVMNEVISAMKVIKMYTWEKPFAHHVAETRENEIKYIKKTAMLKAVNMSLYYVSSKIIVFVTLLCYVLTGNNLTAEKVFVTLSLYNSVRLNMTLWLPLGVGQVAELLVSIQRIQNFLMMEDRVVTPISGNPQSPDSTDTDSDNGIKLDQVNAKWNASSDELSLSNISFDVRSGQLLGIIGPVGSGKSSLLQAILRELPTTSGTLDVKGKIAYISQNPWIFGGSVRDNILFGSQFEAEKYGEVIKACALQRDLDLFPYGDATLVGTSGSSLSGGQKARINLARAVYADCQIYLLDDPLSAVDAEVSRYLFRNCILGALKSKARILVTHQLQFLKEADELILLSGGCVIAQGTYLDLLSSGINFAQLLKTEETLKSHLHDHFFPEPFKEVNPIDPQFRRSASMSTLEIGELNTLVRSCEWEEDSEIIQSFRHPQSRCFRKSRRRSREKGSGKKRRSSSPSERSPLLPPTHDEQMSSGSINMNMYWKYFRAGSSNLALASLIFSNILVQFLYSGSDYWLQYWTTHEKQRPDYLDLDASISNSSEPDPDSSIMNGQRKLDVYVYCGIVVALFITSLIRTGSFFMMCLNSSVNLHKMQFNGVLRAPMRFYETNPVGRILNRFSKDCGMIDEVLPPTLYDTVDSFLQFIGVVVIACSINPILLVPSAVLLIIFYFLRKFYIETARSVKRLEGVLRSPVFSDLSTTLAGLTTIRAFKAEDQFKKRFDSHQDLHSASWYLFLATGRWLAIVVDWCCVSYIGAVAFSFLFFRRAGALVGLAITPTLTLTGMIQWGTRQSAETENQMVSVERVLEFANISPEAPLESPPTKKPPKDWPFQGEICIKKLTLRYGDEAPVLKDISCEIYPKEKIGIAGRTGAGKSSLITTLFRITEPCSGSIEIDGINVLSIGLHELRSKISIIPQDPVLFVGTLRRNLDPFGDLASDDKLWQVLQDVHLSNAIKEMPAGLDSEITEGGSNFSVGQRQLICLVRAILKRNKILILDEATANVDPETDALIQTTIREKFADCTVLTVAHRLHTVMDSDRIIVMDAGRIQEFDEPFKLLMNTKGFLYQMVQQTGKSAAAKLLQIAKNVHDRKHALSMSSVPEYGENVTSSSGSSGTNDSANLA